MRFFSRALIGASLLVSLPLLTSQTAHAAPIEVTVDDSFQGGAFNWEKYGRMAFRWTVIDVKGKAAVCGAFASVGGTIAYRFNEAALNEMRVTVDGVRIAKGMAHFKSSPSEAIKADLVGRTARCKMTTAPAPTKGQKVEMDVRAGEYTVRN